MQVKFIKSSEKKQTRADKIGEVNHMLGLGQNQNGYTVVHEYESERGMETALIKKI